MSFDAWWRTKGSAMPIIGMLDVLEIAEAAFNAGASDGSKSWGGWIDARERMPDREDRFFVIYRTDSNKTTKPWIGDYIESERRWSSLPGNTHVIAWAEVPPYPCNKPGDGIERTPEGFIVKRPQPPGPISATNPLTPGCYCQPGACGAPKPEWCRDTVKRDYTPPSEDSR